MYRNLAPEALGLAGCPLNELVELALTHRFGGLEVDFEEFHRQVQTRGIASAKRYLASAPLKVSSLRLPIHWDGDDQEFSTELEKLAGMLPTAKELGCDLFYTLVQPGSDHRVYHQNFEFHCVRLRKLAEVLESEGMRIGLMISSIPSEQAVFRQPFLNSWEGLVTLVRMLSADNVRAILDLWHWSVGGGTLEQIRQFGTDKIGDVRVADLPETNKPIAELSSQDRVLPSESSRIDLTGAVGLLHELGYAGPITPYPHASQVVGQRRDLLVKQASQAIDDLLKRAGVEIGRRGPVVATR